MAAFLGGERKVSRGFYENFEGPLWHLRIGGAGVNDTQGSRDSKSRRSTMSIALLVSFYIVIFFPRQNPLFTNCIELCSGITRAETEIADHAFTLGLRPKSDQNQFRKPGKGGEVPSSSPEYTFKERAAGGSRT